MSRPLQHVFDTLSTRKISLFLLACLVPLYWVAGFHYGLTLAILGLAVTGGAWVTDTLLNLSLKTREDLQTVVWGLVLTLFLPPQTPWFAGLTAGIFMGVLKRLWGGNTGLWLNPMLAAWAFSRLSWPAAWANPELSPALGAFHQAVLKGTGVSPSILSSLDKTPLDHAFTNTLNNSVFSWIHTSLPPGYGDLIAGNLSGSFLAGTTVLLLLISVFLLVERLIPWEIPALAVLGLALPTWIFGGLSSGSWLTGDVLLQLFGGSFLFGVLFLATDSYSRPFFRSSRWLYGLFIGLFVFFLRFSGTQTDGTGEAILLAGLIVPWLDQLFQRFRAV